MVKCYSETQIIFQKQLNVFQKHKLYFRYCNIYLRKYNMLFRNIICNSEKVKCYSDILQYLEIINTTRDNKWQMTIDFSTWVSKQAKGGDDYVCEVNDQWTAEVDWFVWEEDKVSINIKHLISIQKHSTSAITTFNRSHYNIHYYNTE